MVPIPGGAADGRGGGGSGWRLAFWRCCPAAGGEGAAVGGRACRPRAEAADGRLAGRGRAWRRMRAAAAEAQTDPRMAADLP